MRRFLHRRVHGRNASILSVVDQAVASAASFLIVLVAARLLGVEEFGAFSVVFILYTIVLGAVQAYIGQELTLATGTRAELIGRSWTACKTAAILSLPIAVMTAGFALFLDEVRAPLLVLAIGLPVFVVHETVRFSMALVKAMHTALLIDVLRVALVTVGVAAVVFTDGLPEPTAGVIFALWAVATAASLLPLVGVAREASRLARRLPWHAVFSRDYLGNRFIAEFAAVRASSQALTIFLGVLAGLAATGALRAASTLFGPINMLLSAVIAFAVPVLRERPRAGRAAAVVTLTTALALLSLVFTVALVVMPDAWGEALLGETWAGTKAMLVPVGVQTIGLAVSTVMVVGIRMIDPNSTLAIRLIGSALTVVFFAAGYGLWSVQGAVWGLCLASWTQSLMLLIRYARLERGDASARRTED